MSNHHGASATSNGASGDQRTYFEQQRDELVQEVALSLDNVLQSINRLNRNLEQITAVGHEFSSVEALWSQFEHVMAKDPEDVARDAQEGVSDDDTEITAKEEK